MRRVKLLLFLCGVGALAEEFIISYEVKMQNDLLSGENYKVSKALVSRGLEGIQNGQFKVVKSCQILPEENLEAKEMQKFLKTHKEQVLDCLYSSGIELYDEAITKNLQAQSRTILKIPPKRVVAVLKNGVVDLSVLEKK